MGETNTLTWTRAAPAALAVLLNLVPIAGVVFWNWSAFALIFLYWLENVVVGLRTAAGIVGAAALNRRSVAASAGVAAFFCVHYGMFCFVHGIFVVSLFGGSSASFDLPQVVAALFSEQTGLAAGFAAIVIWQSVQLLLFLAGGDAREKTPFELMAAPYPRMVILHMTIIFSGMLVLMMNEPMAGLVLLTLIKMGFDVAEALGVARTGVWRRRSSGARANQP
jgi:hypothetical protein